MATRKTDKVLSMYNGFDMGNLQRLTNPIPDAGDKQTGRFLKRLISSINKIGNRSTSSGSFRLTDFFDLN